MRVLVWPADQQGSGHYRLIWPGQALAGHGADVTVSTEGPSVLWDREWHGSSPPTTARVVGLAHKPDADVVVIQRPGRHHWAQIIPHLQAAGIRVVVDLDDDFEHIDPRNKAFAGYDPRTSPHHNHAWIRRAAQLADLTTVSTEALARRYAGTGRVTVLPNLVPASYLDVDVTRPETPTVTWTGSVETHPGDLEAAGGAIGRVLAASGAQLRVVGTGEGVGERLGVPQLTATGWLPLRHYPLAYAWAHVAVVPLADTVFNRAKSALKLAEAAALGVAAVASPTPDNQRLHRAGVGLLAGNPGRWQRHLTRLIRDVAFREDLAGHGRQVMAGHTYEGSCDRWADAWASTLQGRRAA